MAKALDFIRALEGLHDGCEGAGGAVSKRDTYTVTASRSDGWWALTVSGPGLKRGYHTQVKRLEQAEEMARDLVITMLDVDVLEMNADFELTVADDEVATELERKCSISCA